METETYMEQTLGFTLQNPLCLKTDTNNKHCNIILCTGDSLENISADVGRPFVNLLFHWLINKENCLIGQKIR